MKKNPFVAIPFFWLSAVVRYSGWVTCVLASFFRRKSRWDVVMEFTISLCMCSHSAGWRAYPALNLRQEKLYGKSLQKLSAGLPRGIPAMNFLRRLQLQDINFRRWSLIIHVIICLLIRKLTHLSGQPNPICKRGWVMSGFFKLMPHHRVVSWHAHCWWE